MVYDFEKLKVIAHLNSPIILGGGFLTFDALLAAIVFERTEDLQKAHNELPLKRTGELSHASSAILFPDVTEPRTFTASMRWQHDMSPDYFKQKRKVSALRKRDFGNVFNTYNSLVAKEVIWYCEGDRDAIHELLEGVAFIGKRRGSGYGEVRNWVIEDGDYDGILGFNDNPMRPIPEALYEGNKDALKIETAWKPPYWEPTNKAICFAPDFVK